MWRTDSIVHTELARGHAFDFLIADHFPARYRLLAKVYERFPV